MDAAAVVMATDGNQALLQDAGLLAGRADAGANDVLVVIRGDDTRVVEETFAALAKELNREAPSSSAAGRADSVLPRSLAMSLREGLADLALISVPDDYARRRGAQGPAARAPRHAVQRRRVGGGRSGPSSSTRTPRAFW